jgi:predicted ATPase
VLWGGCDAALTPRALGPLVDVAEQAGGELAALVGRAAPLHEIADALTGELRGGTATVLALEDVHRADEATLDLLRVLARRVDALPALVVASLRDDELDRAHPLRVALGELATAPAVERMALMPLSLAAVRTLAAPYGADEAELHRKTGGNPFFVTEVLGARAAQIPDSVRDAVLARAARLSPPARGVLEAVAIVPSKVELWLLGALTDGALEPLDECLVSGMLRDEDGAVAFRHELARRAIEETTPPHRRLDLHRRALAALAAAPAGSAVDPARPAYHADAAGDVDAALHWAPIAGARAAAVGAHVEAAAHFGVALRFAAGLPLAQQARLYERRSLECYLTDQLDEALAAAEQALALHRTLGNRVQEGDSLRMVSRLLWSSAASARPRRPGARP